MEEFKENKWSEIISYFAIFLMLGTLILPAIITFIFGLDGIFIIVPFIISLPFICILSFIGKSFSKKDDYTRRFLSYFKEQVLNCKSLTDLENVNRDIWKLSVDKKQYDKTLFPLRY